MDIIRLKVPSGQVCHQIPNQMSTFICRYLFTRWIQSAHLHKQLCNFHCSCRRLGHVLPTAGNVNCQVCAVKLACSKAIQTNIFQKKKLACSNAIETTTYFRRKDSFVPTVSMLKTGRNSLRTTIYENTWNNNDKLLWVVFIEEMSHFENK